MRIQEDQRNTSELNQHLILLRTLEQELARAIEAIETRSLPAFEDSLCRQRAACAQLASLNRSNAAGQERNARFRENPAKEELLNEIKTAALAVDPLNRQFAALLRHSQETIMVFATLFRSYRAPLAQSTGNQHSFSTWACRA